MHKNIYDGGRTQENKRIRAEGSKTFCGCHIRKFPYLNVRLEDEADAGCERGVLGRLDEEGGLRRGRRQGLVAALGGAASFAQSVVQGFHAAAVSVLPPSNTGCQSLYLVKSMAIWKF